jgi:hypothetical protein
MLYLLFTSNLPQTPNFTIGTFTEDTAILTCHNDVCRASSHLQEYLNTLQTLLRTWKIKINKSKSKYLTFTLRNDHSSSVYLNDVEIPPAATIKYLGLHLDNKLNWKKHVIKKRRQMDLRYKDLYWLLGRSSPLSVDNKILLYKSIITPIWTYGIELWGCACKSTIAVIQKSQFKILGAIVDAARYDTNSVIHTNLSIPPVQDMIQDKHRAKLESHPNTLLQHPLRDNITGRL